MISSDPCRGGVRRKLDSTRYITPRDKTKVKDPVAEVVEEPEHVSPPNAAKAEIMKFSRYNLDEAANHTGVSIPEFIKRARNAGIYEWEGRERETRLTQYSEEVLFLIHYQGRNKVLFVPESYTISQFIEDVQSLLFGVPAAEVRNCLYHWKLYGVWVNLFDPQDWDNCLRTWRNDMDHMLERNVGSLKPIKVRVTDAYA